MTYPLTVVPEMHIDGAWTDVTTDGSGGTQVLQRDDIVCRWGRANKETAVPPATISATLKNANGKFSPRNPTSPYYGKIGRNTPFRVRLGSKDAALSLPGLEESYVDTPDVAALDITGDIDIRIELEPNSWRPEQLGEDFLSFARKYNTVGSQRSWAWWLFEGGFLRFRWSPDGTFASAITVDSTAAVPENFGRGAIRVTLDVDNGASQNVVTFYTSSSIDGTWTQLGSTVVTAGTTSIFASTDPVELGRTMPDGVTDPPFTGSIWAFEIRNGIAGTVVADADFTALDPETETFTDSAGRVWTLNGVAAIVDSSVRGAGEISSWPSRWDISGNDVWVPIEASGIRRRLGQGQPTLRSAMYRGMTGSNITTPRAYWPGEDGDKATSLASALAGHPPMRIVGDVNLAAHSDLNGSAPIPTFGTGHIEGVVPGYTATNFMRCMALVDIPDSITGEPNILYLTTTGSVDRWYLSIDSGGDLRIRAKRRDDGTEILNSVIDFNILGKSGLIWIYLTKTGSNSVDYQVGFAAEDSDTQGVAGGTVTSSIGIAKRVISGGLGGDLGGMAVGHITVQDTDEFWDIVEFARAWAGETATERIVRLCAEEDVPLRIAGDAASTASVGPQRIDTFLNLVDAAAKVDQGILADDRDAVRLLFRTGASLANQDVALTINYATGQVAGSLEPVEDDQLTRNDITAERTGGSSARAVLETGTLSVLPPPDGVGRYDDSQEFNAHRDGHLEDLANWLLHLGTVDEARYPTIGVNLARDTGLSTTARSVYVGDRLQVTDPPAWLPPDAIDQLAQGGTERLNRFKHSIVYNCTPASPWTVAVADDTDLGRADTEGSQLAADATSSATTLKVLTTLGPTWTETAAEFPFDVRTGGEVVTVSDIDPLILDTFTRSVTDGWGAADSGQGWSLAGGAAGDYDVNGTRGLVSCGSVAVSRKTILPESMRDADITASVATDVVATGDWITAALVARRVDGSNFYMARVEFKHDGNVGINVYKTIAGTGTALDSGHVLGTYSAAERFNVRFAVIGTALKAKIWRENDPEPAWQIEVTDTDLDDHGNVATHNELASGNTNTLPVVLSWDDLTTKAQKFTATRSVNGVSKAQTAGSDVRLAQPAIAAL